GWSLTNSPTEKPHSSCLPGYWVFVAGVLVPPALAHPVAVARVPAARAVVVPVAVARVPAARAVAVPVAAARAPAARAVAVPVAALAAVVEWFVRKLSQEEQPSA